MKRKKLYQHIKENMPSNLEEIEIAAYIAKEIALNRDFSAKYYWGTKETRNKIYNLARGEKQVKLQNDRELICVTACKLYEYIGNKYGLDIFFKGDKDIITKDDFSIFEEGEHIFPVIKLKDGRYIKVDVEWDLENIKTGLKWIKFGTIDENEGFLSNISDENYDLIMEKIEYKKQEEKYLNDYCEELFKNTENNISVYEKLNLIFNDEIITQRVRKLTGSIEIYRFYRQLIKKFTKESSKNIFLFGISIKHPKCKRNKYTMCTYLNEDDKKSIWIYSKKTRRNVEIMPDELAYYIETKRINMIPGKQGKALENLYSHVKVFDRENNYRNINEKVI